MTCSVSCTLEIVDAACNPFPSDDSGTISTYDTTTGGPLNVQMICSQNCCAGPSNCGSSAYEISAQDIHISALVALDGGGQTSSDASAGTFSPHPSCPDVYALDRCLPAGEYRVDVLGAMGGHVIKSSGTDCTSAESSDSGGGGGCQFASAPPTSCFELLLVAVGVALGVVRRRRRFSL